MNDFTIITQNSFLLIYFTTYKFTKFSFIFTSFHYFLKYISSLLAAFLFSIFKTRVNLILFRKKCKISIKIRMSILMDIGHLPTFLFGTSKI